MKRSPLSRKTPLKRGGPIKRKTRLRPVSAKRAKEQRQRRATLKAMSADQAICQRCHAAQAVDAHEVVPRSAGGSITDPANIRLLCRECHDWIHRFPAAARRAGWLAPKPPSR